MKTQSRYAQNQPALFWYLYNLEVSVPFLQYPRRCAVAQDCTNGKEKPLAYLAFIYSWRVMLSQSLCA